ncbi:MAG: SMP-30/gluconolactonase/LRE family protein [Casimicrobiaceae bacterium]
MATAFVRLAAGTVITVASGSVRRDVTLVDEIPAGHKFAVRALAAGLRIRKYGEFIGRTLAPIATGAHVHTHNLQTGARRNPQDEAAWCTQSARPAACRVIGTPRTTVGESPVWDAASGRLYWVDVRETPAIHMLHVASGEGRSWPMHEDVGAVALAGLDTLVVGLRSGFATFDCTTGQLTPIADPEPDLPGNRLNDGKCDAQGRFWCGSMNPEVATAEGSLYVLDTDRRWRRALGDLLTPNGMTWSLDGRTMYLADTRRGLIHAFDYDLAQGTLGGQRIFADLGALPGSPDGATVDAEDHLWSALWDGGCLVRFDPAGRMERVVRVPVSKPTSCAFGGEGYRELFVTTATRGLDPARLRAEPLAGRVLVLDVGVAGVAPRRFGPQADRDGIHS